jgi:hypothetical protein
MVLQLSRPSTKEVEEAGLEGLVSMNSWHWRFVQTDCACEIPGMNSQFINTQDARVGSWHRSGFRMVDHRRQCARSGECFSDLPEARTERTNGVGAENIKTMGCEHGGGLCAIEDHCIAEVAADDVVHEISDNPVVARRRPLPIARDDESSLSANSVPARCRALIPARRRP